jgi:hypothetical protein
MNIINLPSDFIGNMASSSSSLFTGLAPIVAVIVGTLLALTVIAFVINAMRHH